MSAIELLSEGVYGSSFMYKGEELYLRMERLTPEKAAAWGWFKNFNLWVASTETEGKVASLYTLVRDAGDMSRYPTYDLSVEYDTGFTKEEYETFTAHILERKRSDYKLVSVLKANNQGSRSMSTYYSSSESNTFIAYITKNPNFSIVKAKFSERQLKTYIDLYSDILISVGSNFSKEGSFRNRGISRNPYWVLEGKYSGLSLLLHGFTGSVAKQYYPDKQELEIRPIGSMLALLVKAVLPTEGRAVSHTETKDLSEVSADPTDDETHTVHIKVTALTRIYADTIARLTQ